ncbi:MAG: citrate synthase [Spirochaetaceae bacterium]|nr:MAG: citrate synthase [Spirochaetaceae bacterium]
MPVTAELQYDGRTVTLPRIDPSMGDHGIGISRLRSETGMVSYDPGLANTASCRSAITYLDGENGVLMHHGYAIEDLAQHCVFLEVALLLITGTLPNREERSQFTRLMNKNSMLHEGMIQFFDNYPENSHPMAILSAMVVSLSSFYPEIAGPISEVPLDETVTNLLSKMRTIAAFSYKKSIGEPFVYPSHKLRYCENFLNMMFSSPVADYQIDPVVETTLNRFLILHADHEQNASTTVVRGVGSSGTNLYASIAAGISSLWGTLHGGANQAVIEMLEDIRNSGKRVKQIVEQAKDRSNPFRLMGFGHRVYKTYDPRARIAKQSCRELLDHLGIGRDPLLDIAVELEEAALADDYFLEKKLYPNVDFYTGITYRAMGIPTNMFTVMFALGRLPGWIAHWLEMRNDPEQRIVRPRQIYVGQKPRAFVPVQERG